MKNLTLQQYHNLREGAEVLAHGDKVLLLPDGYFIKLFRLKRLLSSTLIYLYSKRFADNVARLCTTPFSPESIAEISISVCCHDGKDLGYSLIKNNLACPYDGGKKIG